jgi:hypothetical protein
MSRNNQETRDVLWAPTSEKSKKQFEVPNQAAMNKFALDLCAFTKTGDTGKVLLMLPFKHIKCFSCSFRTFSGSA